MAFIFRFNWVLVEDLSVVNLPLEERLNVSLVRFEVLLLLGLISLHLDFEATSEAPLQVLRSVAVHIHALLQDANP